MTIGTIDDTLEIFSHHYFATENLKTWAREGKHVLVSLIVEHEKSALFISAYDLVTAIVQRTQSLSARSPQIESQEEVTGNYPSALEGWAILFHLEIVNEKIDLYDRNFIALDRSDIHQLFNKRKRPNGRKSVQLSSQDEWCQLARTYADGIWLRTMECGKRPTKLGVAEEIYVRFKREGVLTKMKKVVSTANIERHALREWIPPDR